MNVKKELIVEIKQHLSSTACSKVSKNDVNKYITSLEEQIESLKGEILVWKKEKNVPTKYKCIASTADGNGTS